MTRLQSGAMAAGDLRIDHTTAGTTQRLALAGELDVATVAQLESALAQARPAADLIEVDLGGLSFIDSTGLRALLTLHQASEADGFAYRLLAGPPLVHRTFTLTGLDQVLVFAAR
jgi:anti-anti-sigma factor